jgi:16S rRNA (adenine1518-N6/adenine1519-N6)-dimethyltransferase
MRPKKSLGQNFLTSTNVVDDIVRAGEIRKGETVLEIGPGKGILTSALLKAGAHVIAVEKDDYLYSQLLEKFRAEIDSKQLEIIHDDILQVSLSMFSNRGVVGAPGERVKTRDERICEKETLYKIIANIPYNITGQIFRKFLESVNPPTSMTVLVQKEVAERIVAQDKKESILSISVKVYGEPRIIRRVGRGSFFPAPNVDSAVLHIANISKNKIKNNEKKFFEILNAGFAHKRKLLISNLASVYDKSALSSAFEKLSISEKARAEDLSVDEWVKLTDLL